ncbi:MAG: hypothetical protein AUJ20_08405 [Comamonadaceae bacterium CG1_02_60_18]|nr:MAG: hypothetical protein AUJ20_08405 [Comamonadaceae bacterium CG1_02_60_18]PIQ56219.1 MAG: MFS transporter [Comamonadaceae bacterium CG12_big_fil_rev_8_21_14_0_65_59_15]
MRHLFLPLTSLLSGVGLLVVGTGLLFSVIGTQAASADFAVLVTGLIMSAYFGGFIFGTYWCPHMIRRVGHIRSFAAMASVASTVPLLHALWLNPWFWGGLRFVTGVCLVGLYMVVESWLNVIAAPTQRGKVFAAYMAVSGVAMALGQWLILVGDRYGFVPFALVSILFSFALLPITLTPVNQPEPVNPPSLSLTELFNAYPVGVAGAMASGLLTGAFYSLGHVFGQRVAVSESGIATFMAATILGGAVFQWPVGYWSDKNDRRWVLFWVCLAGAAVAALGFYLAMRSELALIATGVVLGGLMFSIYGLSVAHANDLTERSKMLQVSGGLLLLHGVGATMGPILAGGLMQALGPGSLMLYFSAVLVTLALLITHWVRLKPLNRGEPGQKEAFVAMSQSASPMPHLDPRNPDSPAQQPSQTG